MRFLGRRGALALRGLQGAALVLLLALIPLSLASWRQRPDAGSDRRYREELSRLQAADTALASEILSSRAGLVAHYDDIVRRVSELRQLGEWLRRPPAFVEERHRAEIAASVDAYLKTIDAREEHLDSFKFDQAVLRNSLRFFPTEALALAERVEKGEQGQALATELGQFYSNVLLYHLFRDERLRLTLGDDIRRFSGALPEFVSAEDARDIALLAQHASVIVERTPLVDGAVEAALLVDSKTPLKRLRELYDQSYAEQAKSAANLRFLAWLSVLALVLVSAGIIILRMRRSAKQLSAATEELERALADLEEEKEKHKELAELKSRFVSMTSHEFRTPLSVVLSSAELLQAYGSKWSEDKRQTHLAKVKQAATYMKQMLDEVLLIGRAEAGRLVANPEALELQPFCEGLIESLRLHAGADNRFDLQVSEEVGAVLVDEVLLTHVVDNLLGNAVKYSEPGSEVRLKVCHSDGELHLEVSDEGIGIPEADQQRLFETFHRGSNVGTISGTGLGLAVVRRSLDVLGGQIEFSSREGEGTRFEVRVPAPIAEQDELRNSA